MRDAREGVRRGVSLRVRKQPRCGHAKQQGLLSPKKSVIHCETSRVSRKSPRVFVPVAKMWNDCAIFFLKNARFRKKNITFALDKTQPFLFSAALRRPYSANFAGFAPCIGANDL